MPKVPSLLLLLVGSTLALAALHAPSPPSLSPADWPPGALAGLMEYSSYFGPHPETNLTCPANLQCNRGGVVSGSSNVLAEYAGYFAYLRGGNAIDACLVTAITQTVLAANSWVNVGGIADIVFVNGSTGASQTIYGVWGRPSEAQQAALNSRHIGGTVLIGGFLSAVEAASAAFGQLPFSSLFDAAVYFAEFGSPTEPVRYLDMTALNFTSEGRELRQQLLNKSATTFTQQDLAVFLKKVQSEGSSHFYNGSFAQRAVEVTGSYGGNLSLQDFSAYQAALHSDEAVKFAVRGETFALSVQNTNLSFGAVELVEQIHIMAASPLFDAPFTPSAEIPYNGNATQWAWLVEISFWTTIMSDMFLGSAASIRFAAITFNDVFGSVCPELTDATLSDEVVGLRFMQCRQRSALGTAVWRLIESNATSFNARLKSLFGDGKTAQRPRSHSDAVTAVDAEGNFCSVAHSINTGTMWGTGIFVEGVPLSNAGAGGLDRRFIFADDQTSGARFLATPTRPLVVRSVTNPGKGFAFSAIGDSLAEVTLNLLAVLLNEPASVDVVTASPTFLLAAMRPGMPFSVHINMCSNCTTTDPICPQYNARMICATPRFLEQLPAWITPYVLPMYGMDRLKHNGPMAISRRFDSGRRLDASSTPELNGASFGSIWQE